jgi:hypothetical protein
MANTFIYKFDEVPLHLSGDIEGGLINGSAEIEYSRDGDWSIVANSICLEGYKRITSAERKAGKSPWVFIPAPDAIAQIISHRLQYEWYDNVTSAVSDQIEEDREVARDEYADMKRDMMREAV